MLRADGSCVHELRVERIRIVMPFEMLEWVFEEWSDEWTIESTTDSVQFRLGTGFEMSDFGMDRPPTRWCDAPACESDAWSVFLPESTAMAGATAGIHASATENGAECARMSARAPRAGAYIPLMLMVSRWDRRLPSIVSACARASGSALQCRIIHLDGSGVFAPFCASEDCEATMFDVNEAGSGPATCFEDATRGRKAIEIFGTVAEGGEIDLTVSGVCPPGVAIAKQRHIRTCFSANPTRMCEILAELCSFELKRTGASLWKSIPIPSHIFTRFLIGKHITAAIECAHGAEPGDDAIVLSTKGAPPIRISRRECRLDAIDIEFGRAAGVQANRMRILARGASSQMNKNTNIDAYYRPCVIPFSDRDRRSQGVGLLPPAYSIALHSHGSVTYKSTLPRACDLRCTAEDGTWEPEASDYLPMVREPEGRKRVLHASQWRAFAVRVADAPAEAMPIANKSHGFPTEAFLPIDVAAERAATTEDHKRRRLDDAQ